MRAYEVILHEKAWAALAATKGAERSEMKTSCLEGMLPKSDSRSGPIVGACLQAIFWTCATEDRLQAGSYIHCGTPKLIWATNS